MSDGQPQRLPVYAVVLPPLGVLAWLAVGKVGLELLAAGLAVVLLGNVVAAVHHAEVVARRLGEPFGAMMLALAVTTIEVGMVISLMRTGEPNPALMRDSVHAVVMLVVHGLAGLCIVVGAIRHKENEFRVEGANAFLAVLIPMAMLVLVLPNFVDAPGPTPLVPERYLVFVSLACAALYAAFLFIQTNWHRDYFIPPSSDGEEREAPKPTGRHALIALTLMCVALTSVVVLAKSLSPALQEAVTAIGAPPALVGIVVAAIVLLPESAAAVRAALANRLQSSLNLALGSAVACIGLTVPTVAVVSRWIDRPLQLGVSPATMVLMTLGFLVAMITYGTGRTNLLSGLVHLVLLATSLFFMLGA